MRHRMFKPDEEHDCCGTCAYWLNVTGARITRIAENNGYCHANPPTAVWNVEREEVEGSFPPVDIENWCGFHTTVCGDMVDVESSPIYVALREILPLKLLRALVAGDKEAALAHIDKRIDQGF